MPIPTIQDVHVNRPLTDISVAFEQAQTHYISTQVFPVVQSNKKSDLYFTYDKRDWYRSEAQKRAPGAESAGSGYRQATDNFNTEVYAVHKDIAMQTRANQDNPLDLDRDAARWVTQQILIKRDKEWAAQFFTAGVWTTDITPATLWDVGGSTPIDDVTNEMMVVAGKTGFKPNTIVAGAEVFNVLRNHPDVLDRIKFSERGVVTTDILAAVFDVERFLPAWAVEDSSAELAATDGTGFIFGKNLLLAYSAPAPSLLAATAGYQFVWSGLVGAGETGMRVSTFELPEKDRSTRVEGELAVDMKVVSADLASLFAAVIS